MEETRKQLDKYTKILNPRLTPGDYMFTVAWRHLWAIYNPTFKKHRGLSTAAFNLYHPLTPVKAGAKFCK